MGHTAIVTDSTAELSPALATELGITVVPWRIGIGGDTLDDLPDFCTPGFHRDTAKRHGITSASPPRAQFFSQVYSRLAKDAEEIVSIHASSELGRAVSAAREGRMALLGKCDVHVVDSLFVSRALGMLVVRAARAAQAGVPGAEIVRLVHGLIPRTYFAFHVDSLDLLVRNGLYQSARDLGSGLARSLLMMEDGRIVSLRRSRRRGTPVERLVDFVNEFAALEELVIVHAGLSDGLTEIRSCLSECLLKQPVEEHCYGPVLASRIGPRALGVVAFEAATH